MDSISKVINYINENVPFTSTAKYGKHTKYYINNKIFAILYEGNNPHIILKADGKFNIKFRKEFKETVMPSYTINTYHWNMILLDSEIPLEIIFKLTQISYDEVVETMTKRQKETYEHLLNIN